MKGKRGFWISITGLILLIFAATFGSLGSYSRQSEGNAGIDATGQDHGFYDQFPIAVLNRTEEPEAEKRAERARASKRYDHRGGAVEDTPPVEDFEQAMFISEESQKISALPSAESDLIVIGTIIDANAYVSNNRKGVYSEFRVRIAEALKQEKVSQQTDSLITVDRQGGYVLYPNGKKRLYFVAGLAMPRVGEEYMLFLKKAEGSSNYEIITGYGLGSKSGISSINSSEQSRAYRGMGRSTFVRTVRELVADGSGTPRGR